MTDFIWPSDMDRAEHEELQRVCEHLEQVVDERDEYRNHLAQICEMLGEMPNGKPDIGAAWESVAALTAQNKLFRSLLTEHFEEWEKDSGSWDEFSWHDRVSAAIGSSTFYCLAQVKSQAIEDFSVAMEDFKQEYDDLGYEDMPRNQTREYVSRIRQEAK